MWLASKSKNDLFCCRRRTIRVGLRQYFCYRLLKNNRNDFLLRYIDDAVCIQSEFGNDRKANEGEGHKNADIFRYTMCLEGIMRKIITEIISEASGIATWVYVQKYEKHKTLDEMLQEWQGAGPFIIVMDTWFEKLMAE